MSELEAGDAWAICFYLKTQGKNREYVERQEVTGKCGDPIQQQTSHKLDLNKLNVRELEQLRDLIRRAQPEDAGGRGPATRNGVSSTPR